MADYSKLSHLVSGAQRSIDTSQNTFIFGSIKIGTSTPTELTKTILNNLVALQNGSDFSVGTNAHTHDGRYFTETELGAITGTTGSDLIGDDNTYTNFTPATTTVKAALAAIDSALSTAGGNDFSDALFRISDDSTPSKKIAFQAGGISVSTVRTITMPDADVNLGALTNSNIDAAAAIAFSKLAALTSGSILVGSAGNVATSVTMSSEATIVASGAVTLSNAAVIAKVLTGFSAAVGTVSAADSILSAFQKIDANVTATASVANAALPSASFTDSAVTSKLITGYVSGAGVVAATDSILQAINKLNGNDAAKLPLAGGTMSGNIAMGGNKLTGLAAGSGAGDSVRYEQAILASGANAFSADQSHGGFKITTLADGTLAQDATTKSQMDTAVGLKVSKSGDTMSGNLAMGSNKITGLSNGTASNDAVNYSQLTAAIGGVSWLNPILDPDLIDANRATQPGTAAVGDVYIASTTAGDWTAGHAYFSIDNAVTWVDLLGRAVAIGDRFGVSMETPTAAVGVLSGKDNYIVTVTTATPGSVAFATEHAPADQDGTYVNADLSHHFGHQYTYSATSTAWIEFGGTSALNAGTGLSISGNVLSVNLGAGIAQLPTDEVGVDVHASGGLFTTADNSTSSTATGAQLAIKINGSSLSKSASGLEVAAAGIAASHLAAAVAGDMIAGGAGTALSVDLAAASGLESTNAGNTAGQLRIKLEASNPSLKFSGTNELAAKLDAAGAIASGASGLAVQVDASTIEISSNALRVKDAGITLAKLASASVDENKIVSTTFSATGAIVGGSGTKAAVQVDASTIEISANALRVKDAGITAAKLAAGTFDQTTITGGTGSAAAVQYAPAIKEVMTAGEAFAATTLFAVRFAKAADAGFVASRAYKASNDATSADDFYVIGLAYAAGSVAIADPITATKMGVINVPTHGFTVGAPLFLSAAGAITATAPSAANTAVVRVGMVRDANNIEVQIQVVGVN